MNNDTWSNPPTTPGNEGWWQASDGQWYPPSDAPSGGYQPPLEDYSPQPSYSDAVTGAPAPAQHGVGQPHPLQPIHTQPDFAPPSSTPSHYSSPAFVPPVGVPSDYGQPLPVPTEPGQSAHFPPQAPQHYATAPYGMVPPKSATNGLAIASLVLGLLSLAFGWIPIFGVVLTPLALVGFALGIAGIRVAKRLGNGRGMAIAGATTSVLTLLIIVGWFVLFSQSDGIDPTWANSDPSDGVCDETRYYQDPDCG